MNISQEILMTITDNYNKFYKELQFLKKIELGDKLYSDGVNILVDKQSYYQGFFRYLYGETRYTGLTYIKNIMKRYITFLKDTLDSCLNYDLTYDGAETLHILLEFNKDIIQGLKVLDLTYENFKELKDYIKQLENEFILFSFNIYKTNKSN